MLFRENMRNAWDLIKTCGLKKHSATQSDQKKITSSLLNINCFCWHIKRKDRCKNAEIMKQVTRFFKKNIVHSRETSPYSDKQATCFIQSTILEVAEVGKRWSKQVWSFSTLKKGIDWLCLLLSDPALPWSRLPHQDASWPKIVSCSPKQKVGWFNLDTGDRLLNTDRKFIFFCLQIKWIWTPLISFSKESDITI